MAWQPPDGWRELNSERRAAYLEQLGMRIPLRPADWDDMEHEQRMAYLDWSSRIMHDTPEKRAAEWGEYQKKLQAWWILMGWWIACLIVALALVWWPAGPSTGANMVIRAGFTVFVLAGYGMAILLPMWLTKPSPPASGLGTGRPAC